MVQIVANDSVSNGKQAHIVMALSLHLYTLSTQVTNAPEHLPYGVALVLILIVLILNSVSIAFRMHLRNKKKW